MAGVCAQERFGKNKFEISLPAFMDLYKQQLVSPFTVFQLFCVILWCLDSYWQVRRMRCGRPAGNSWPSI